MSIYMLVTCMVDSLMMLLGGTVSSLKVPTQLPLSRPHDKKNNKFSVYVD